MPEYIEFSNVKKTYGTGETQTNALDGVSFYVRKGEFCVIIGPSGAGKTTVMNILGGIDRCTSGSIFVDDVDIARKSDVWLTNYRRFQVGFVLQSYNLIRTLTAVENVELASEIAVDAESPRKMLDSMGLEGRKHDFPSRMSGGEQQRVAIARALVKKPSLLLCDEPTGALDSQTGVQILSLLQKASRESGATVVLITHNNAIMNMANRIICMRNGTIQKILFNHNPIPAAGVAL
jgi:putative ABC transport system ATP-binding protein